MRARVSLSTSQNAVDNVDKPENRCAARDLSVTPPVDSRRRRRHSKTAPNRLRRSGSDAVWERLRLQRSERQGSGASCGGQADEAGWLDLLGAG